MHQTFRLTLGLSILSVAIWGSGCGTAVKPEAAKEKDSHAGHDHGHDHSHAHGIHGGHIVEIGEEEYHAEWTHDESGKIAIYILDANIKKDVPIEAEKVVIQTKVGEKETSYDLPAVNRTSDEKPTAFQFEIEDKALLGVLESLSKGVTAKLLVDINGKSYTANIEHDDHDHKH